jgi:putative tricarboxylic transport membrane protein
LIGVFSLNSNIWEIIIMTIFGIVGYLLRKLRYEAAPLIFALVLSPILENSLRQALLMAEGSFEIFFIRPISAILLIAGIILFIMPVLPRFKRVKLSDKF